MYEKNKKTNECSSVLIYNTSLWACSHQLWWGCSGSYFQHNPYIDKKKCLAFDCISSGQTSVAVCTEINYSMQSFFSSAGCKANQHIAMPLWCIKPWCGPLHSRTGREREKQIAIRLWCSTHLLKWNLLIDGDSWVTCAYLQILLHCQGAGWE